MPNDEPSYTEDQENHFVAHLLNLAARQETRSLSTSYTEDEDEDVYHREEISFPTPSGISTEILAILIIDAINQIHGLPWNTTIGIVNNPPLETDGNVISKNFTVTLTYKGNDKISNEIISRVREKIKFNLPATEKRNLAATEERHQRLCYLQKEEKYLSEEYRPVETIKLANEEGKVLPLLEEQKETYSCVFQPSLSLPPARDHHRSLEKKNEIPQDDDVVVSKNEIPQDDNLSKQIWAMGGCAASSGGSILTIAKGIALLVAAASNPIGWALLVIGVLLGIAAIACNSYYNKHERDSAPQQSTPSLG